MARRRGIRSSESADINILPVLNLFSVLIPFIMMAAVFAEVAVLHMSLPIGSGEEGQAPERPPLMLTVIVTKDGLTIGASGGFMDTILLNPDGTYNYSELKKQLTKIKEAYPDEYDIIVAAELQIKYEILISIMDVAKESGFPAVQLSGLHGAA